MIPIFFIHKGDSTYLKYSINQVKKSNYNSDIYLIGDESNSKDIYKYSKHINFRDYMNSANKFKKIYKHLSSNEYEYELFCFQRWFILKDYIKTMKYNGPILYLDSDVLLYCDITEFWNKNNGYDMSICGNNGPEYTFFKNIDVLEELCEFIMDLYRKDSKREELTAIYNNNFLGKNPGGICDMTALRKFCKLKGDKVINLNVIRNNQIFDHNFNLSEGFEMKGNTKKIVMKDKKPYGILLDNKNKVEFNAIHFQNKSKYKMHRYYTGDGFIYYKIIDEIKGIIIYDLIYTFINKTGSKDTIKKFMKRYKK